MIDDARYTAAAVQATPVWFDLAASVDKAVRLIEEAATEGARLIAFPETWIPGYPAYVYGSAEWDERSAKEVHRELLRNSITVSGPEMGRLRDAARRCGAMVVIGVNERDDDFSGGTIYNSMVYISSAGELLGVHRKLIPTHAERLIWGRGDGSGLHVFDTELGRVGGLVCWEHWMPLSRYAMHAKGEQVHVATWPEVPEIHHLASRHYAFEGRCFVICVGSYLTLNDVPADFGRRDAMKAGGDFGGGADVLLPGGSGIIGPDGQWIAGPQAGAETIVYGDIDLRRIGEEQLAFDAAGHYNRPDVFQLTVDERPKAQARWLRDEEVPLLEPAQHRFAGVGEQ
jgi:predicted amidohydrolase